MRKSEKSTARSINFAPDVEKALQAHMKAKNLRNVSQAVNDAMRFALFPEARDDNNHDLAKLNHQILYSLNEHRKKTARDLAANQEILLQFILEYYKQTSALSDEANSERSEGAIKRLDALMEEVVGNLGKAQPMRDDD